MQQLILAENSLVILVLPKYETILADIWN